MKVIKEDSNPSSPTANGNLISSPLILSPTIDTSPHMVSGAMDEAQPPVAAFEMRMTSNKSSSSSLDTDSVALHRIDSKGGKKQGRGKGSRGGAASGGYITKRSADRITVEGSPLVRAMSRKSTLSESIENACSSSANPLQAMTTQPPPQAAPNKKTNHNRTPAAFKRAPMFSPSKPKPMADIATAQYPPRSPAPASEVVAPQAPAPFSVPVVEKCEARASSAGTDQKVLVISAVLSDSARGHNTGIGVCFGDALSKIIS